MASIREKVTRKGVRFEARITRVGMPAKARTFPDIKAAQRWATDVEARYFRGDLRSLPVRSLTVARVIDEYLVAHLVPKTAPLRERHIWGAEKARLGAVRDTLGDVGVAMLSASRFMKWFVSCLALEIPDKDRLYAPSTVRKWYFSTKSALLWHAHLHGYVLPAGCFDVDLPAAWGAPRERRLTVDEIKAIEAACLLRRGGHRYWLFFQLVIETAARAQELSLATCGEFDLSGRSWAIPLEHVKNRVSRDVPLSLPALDILRELKVDERPRDERVFDLALSSFKRNWSNIFHDAGIVERGFGLHVARHEAIARWVTTKTKLTLPQLMLMSGHSDPRTFLIYAKMRGSDLAHLLDD